MRNFLCRSRSMRWPVAFAIMVAIVVSIRAAEPAAPPNAAGFSPAPFPDPGITGFRFPEQEATILKWVAANDQQSIARHAWGIWSALTSRSGQSFEGKELLVFETWYTPDDIVGARLLSLPLGRNPREPAPLTPLRQLSRGNRTVPAVQGDQNTVLGFVKLDPMAAKHITENKLFSQSVLKVMLSSGQANVPAFDPAAVSLKVVFRPIPRSSLVGGRYFMLPAWPGPPSPAKQFPPSAWGQCIWIDVSDTGDGAGTGKVDMQCKPDGSSRTPESTYGLGRFIYFRQSVSQAHVVNAILAATQPATRSLVVAGDPAVLLGMHVTTRELTRWTWQTFWWEPDPAHPREPSSAENAAARPSQLLGAARNYAVATAYSTEFPPQPNTGGANLGESVYAYNPWLEAGFGPSDLPNSKPGTSHGQPVANNVGVQTNCMSCHAQACFSPTGDLSGALYTGDRYVDLSDPQFKPFLRTDFLWSIPDNAQ